MTMLEKIAGAVWEAWARSPTFKSEWEGISWETIYARRADIPAATAIYDTAMIEARAAVEAMREPTEAMIGAALDAKFSDANLTTADHWRAMIDAILAEPVESEAA